MAQLWTRAELGAHIEKRATQFAGWDMIMGESELRMDTMGKLMASADYYSIPLDVIGWGFPGWIRPFF